MKISGLQKVSTIDYPGEIACTIFLYGCNFRCGFCYNPALVIGDDGGAMGNGQLAMGEFSEGDILDFLEKRVGKLDAVCITGGEPLMSLDFDFVRKVKEMGFKVKVDTNGSFPERLREMVDLKLVDYIAMDVKGDKKDYEKIVRVKIDLKKIERSIKIVDDFGGEFRTTVVPGLHDERSLKRMGKWMGEVCEGKPGRIFLQGFKKGEGMIDSSFNGKAEVLEGELVKLKGAIDGLFGEVGVRC